MEKTASGRSVARGFVLALLLLGVSGGQALAHRAPSNCNANRLTLSLDQNPAGNIVSGQTVTYTVGVFNPGPGTGIGCDVTGTTVTFTCPGADGTPSGQTTVLGTGSSFPADNSGDTIFPSVSCKIMVNSGVTLATARAQAGQNTGNRTADLTKGVLHDSAIDDPFVRINDLSVNVRTCVAKVDKQVSCGGGLSFHDVGLVTSDEDGHTDVCFGWNAFTINGTSIPGEAVQVRYVVANAGTADLLTCSITEGNAGFPTTVSVGSLAGACVADVDCGNAQATCVNGACVITSGANSATCSATLSAAEPDTATVTCDCTSTPGEVQATAFDEASFECQTPGLTVTKVCAEGDVNGNNAITITAENTGTADLENCTITDTNFTDAGCPASGDPTGTSAPVAVSPSTIASLAHGSMATATGTAAGLTNESCNTATVTCEIKGSVDANNPGHQKTLTGKANDTCEVPICSLAVEKTACVAAAAPPGAGCTGGAIALTLKYTGASISGPTTVTVTGASGASVTYSLESLNNGDILTMASENDFTIDATAHGQSKLGSKTTVTINGDSEVLHTSCSCRATPETNLALCNPACLDSSSPDNTTGFKGAPSPLWTLVGLKDPKLGTETCGGTVGGGTEGECTTDLPTPPAGGTASADVTYTYKITNTGTTTVHNVIVEDDKLGTIAGSPIASIAPGGMATLTVTQSVAGTTLNTVTVKGNNGFCEATATAAVVAPCVLGYPFTSTDPRTSVVFNESEVLRAFRPSVARPGERLIVFYNDEHALTLGLRRVLVKTSGGTTMTDYPLSPLTSSPDGVLAPQVGTMALDGDQAGTDTSSCAGFPDLCDRPLFPALFITDITDDPSSRAGDWQFGGTPIAPDAVFGTWKGAVRTVDATRTPPQITVTPDREPAKNNYNLDGDDAAPTGLTNQGYGAEIVWDVDTLLADGVLQEGRVYRVQFMVHDGDQNKVGGDTGEGCATVFLK